MIRFLYHSGDQRMRRKGAAVRGRAFRGRQLTRTSGLVLLALLVAVATTVVADTELTASSAEYVEIGQGAPAPAPPPTLPGGSTGVFQAECGRNEIGIRNSDNVIATPGETGAAHHVHDYVGNVSTNAFSTDESLAAADTTCRSADRSTYYWPVLRVPDDSREHHEPAVDAHNSGRILVPDRVLLEFRGNPVSEVVPMPPFLRASAGNARGLSSGGAGTERVQWSCSGERGLVTSRQYPMCPAGQQVVRVFDFPSCWNGRTVDSSDHRGHVVFPAATGACPVGTFPVPELHIELTYLVPPGAGYAIDTFPEEHRSPIADHADFINVMPDALMAEAVECINSGRHCAP